MEDPNRPTECVWYVRREVPWANDPDWYPDSEADLYREEPCGAPTEAPTAFCAFHRVPMEMDLLEFEREVDNGTTWSY